MSYRLIDANAIALVTLRPEVNYMPYIYAMPCIYADLPNGFDNGYYDMREMERIKDENAKLRELIADCMLMPGPYGEKYGIEPNFIVCSNHWGDRARDLGIEV